MSHAVDPALLRSCSFFAEHPPEELADLAQFMRPIRAAKGARLFTQGDTAEGMYLIETGRVRIVSRLPGDRTVELGQVGPGEPFGEVALVIQSEHSTTAEALEPISGCFFSRLHFEMLRNDLRPSAFRTMNAITLTLCRRIRGQIEEVRQTLTQSARLRAFGPGEPAPAERTGRASHRVPEGVVDAAALRRLPLFQAYSAAELRAFLRPLRPLQVPRGARLYGPGDPPERCLLIVRGALRLSAALRRRTEAMQVLGPSQMVGELALMDGRPHTELCEVREDATLLEMDRKRFDALRAAADPVGFKFFEGVNRSLVGKLRKNNRHLALLAVQGRLPEGARQGT
jgi:CRP-like cAMP-binding protein